MKTFALFLSRDHRGYLNNFYIENSPENSAEIDNHNPIDLKFYSVPEKGEIVNTKFGPGAVEHYEVIPWNMADPYFVEDLKERKSNMDSFRVGVAGTEFKGRISYFCPADINKCK